MALLRATGEKSDDQRSTRHLGSVPREPRDDRILESYARRKLGIPWPTLRYFSSVPWLTRALLDLHPEYGLVMHLDQNIADSSRLS